jgi:hypothetical protein
VIELERRGGGRRAEGNHRQKEVRKVTTTATALPLGLELSAPARLEPDEAREIREIRHTLAAHYDPVKQTISDDAPPRVKALHGTNVPTCTVYCLDYVTDTAIDK